MKKKLFTGIGLVCLLTSFFFIFGMTANKKVALSREPLVPEKAITKEEDIWIITDVHYLAESLFDDGENFAFIKETGSGKELDYPAERMQALVWEIQQEQPEMLLVSGDLTLNGEQQSALDLQNFFAQIEDLGTQVYVIPGNHDISNGWARRFEGDDQQVIEQILPEEFQLIFEDFGYTEAYSLDEDSLSYAVQPFTNLTLLMLDTNVYSETKGSGAPPSNGVLKKETLAWIESILQDAEGTTVLPILHHNLMAHNEFMNEGIVLDNASELQALFAKYNIRTAFSGHTHIQDIASTENNGTTLYDITTAAFSIMAPSIGKISVDDTQIAYQKDTLNVDEWAQATKQTDENLLHYSDYATQLFINDGIGMGMRQMFEEQWFDEAYGEEVAKFVGENNRLFFSGKNSQLTSDQTAQIKESSAYRAIEENSKGFLLRYTDTILENDGHSDVTFNLPLEK